MFFEPERTPYDLNWRMLGTWVRVHPFFWLFTAILGWDWMREGFSFLLLWIACVFVSILVHEFGHVLMGRVFGASGYIVLYTLGGLAVGSSALPKRWQRVAVFLAGPMAGFLLAGLVYAVWKKVPENQPVSPFFKVGVAILLWINLGWGILNLLPIWPLDGGRVCRELCEWLDRDRGTKVAFGISIVVAGFFALHAALNTMKRPIPALEDVPFFRDLQGWYIVLLFGMLAFDSYQRLQYEQQRSPWDDGGDSWKR